MTDRPDKTFFLETFGCQMNFLDSELVLGQLLRMGYRRTGERDSADLILFNTCSVRDHAEQRVNSRLGELRQVKADRPGILIAVIGCQAERVGRALFSRFPHVDVLCGPGELDKLPGLVGQAQASRRRAVALSGGIKGRRQGQASGVGDWASEEKSPTPPATLTPGPQSPDPMPTDGIEALDRGRGFAPGDSPLQAYVRVQRGCDKFCTFCIVPAVRGPERSRRPEQILAEVRRLAQAGCREVTLLGQTINSYLQHDADGLPVTLARLLERVAAIDGLLRVRFVTSFPGGFDEDILRAMASVEKVCPYLHIPAQSASDRVLRAMKRQYIATDYYRLMDRARELVPGISLAGDFIVGFPGETDEDFAATVAMVRRVRYKNCFVFKYSPRPGTAAFRNLPDDVPDAVKRDRNNELLAVQAEISSQANRELIGRSVNVLIEGYSKQAAPARQLTGRTAADQIVVFDCPEGVEVWQLVGRLADVRVTAVTPTTLIGELAGQFPGGMPAARPGSGASALPLRYKSLTAPNR